MAAITTAILAATAVAGLGLSAYGTVQSAQAQSQSAQLSQQQIRLQRQAEAERKKAMELDAIRQRREIIRRSIAARSVATATATNQGAQYGSALPGAYGGISGQTGVKELALNQNLEIGQNIFGINNQISRIGGQITGLQSSAATYAGLSSFGFALAQNAGTIGNIGTYLAGGTSSAAYNGNTSGFGLSTV